MYKKKRKKVDNSFFIEMRFLRGPLVAAWLVLKLTLIIFVVPVSISCFLIHVSLMVTLLFASIELLENLQTSLFLHVTVVNKLRVIERYVG